MIEYDYFEDYEEFDERIEEFKDSLRNEIKDEIKNKIEKLESRNKELEEKQKNLSKLENEYKEKIRKLESEKEQVIYEQKSEFYKNTIKEIIDKVFACQKLYDINFKNVEMPKCNCCDENRKIIATDMFGRKHKVDCQCRDTKKKYFYKESDKQISIWKSKGKDNIHLTIKTWRSWYSTDTEEVILEYTTQDKEKRNYIIEKFDENNLPENYRYAYFTDEKEAQKYVDYLNSKE